jgi:hypothetical protein
MVSPTTQKATQEATMTTTTVSMTGTPAMTRRRSEADLYWRDKVGGEAFWRSGLGALGLAMVIALAL